MLKSFESKLNSALSVKATLFTKSSFYRIHRTWIFPIHPTSRGLPPNSCFPQQQSVTFLSARYKERIQTHCTLFIVHKLTHIHAWATNAPVIANDFSLSELLWWLAGIARRGIRLFFQWPDKTVRAWMHFGWKFMDESPKPGGSEMLCCMH